MMIQKKHKKPWPLQIDCVMVEGLIREAQRVKVRDRHCKKKVVQYFTSLGKEHYHEGKFSLVKR
jgi:hypothetical protein